MAKATVPDIEGHAAREGYARKKRDGTDMAVSSFSPGDMK